MRRPTVPMISPEWWSNNRYGVDAYRRHLPRCKRNILVQVRIRDPVLLSRIRGYECSGRLTEYVIMSYVASRELETVVLLQRSGELFAIDKDSITFYTSC